MAALMFSGWCGENSNEIKITSQKMLIKSRNQNIFPISKMNPNRCSNEI